VPAAVSSDVGEILAAAAGEGRHVLFEHESFNIVQALGIAVPVHALIEGPAAVAGLDLSQFSGDSLVLKIVSPTIVHKSDVGGVQVVARERSSLSGAVEQMAARVADLDVVGFLVEEYIPHPGSLGDELLLGLRRTPEFGPVVSLGLGGVYSEFLAEALEAGREMAIVSPQQATTREIERALSRTAVVPLITGQLRGQAARVSVADLSGLIGRALDFATSPAAESIAELEINPLVLGPAGPVALDAATRLVGAPEQPEPARPLEQLDRLLEPRSIALVGVSSGQNPGRTMLRNILASGFDRDRVFVVKQGRRSIDGCRCVPNLAALPERMDLLVVSVQALQVPAIVEEVIREQIAATMILVSGGLGEASDARGLGQQISSGLRTARAAGLPGPLVNGGNCLGIRSVPGHYDTLFIPGSKLRFPSGSPGRLALISQSGAFAAARSSKLWNLNPRYVITLGNQIDLTVGDYLSHLEADVEVDLFACYVEGFRPGDGSRWLASARRIVDSGRDVILYRAGRSAASSAATASHTASIAGDYAVTRQLAEAAGVVVAETIEDFEDLVRVFTLLRRKRVDGMRLGAVSNAGFECVAMADSVGRLELAELAPATNERLAELFSELGLEDVVQPRNPLDLTPSMGDEAYERAVRNVLDDAAVDIAVVGCVPLSGAITTLARGKGHVENVRSKDSIAARLARLHADSSKAWVAVVDGGPLYQPMAEVLEAAGVPTFRAADRALAALGRYASARVMRSGRKKRDPAS